MLPLTTDDLLPLQEYAARRREFFESHRRYLDRYRRVRIGPRVALVFENRQTLWFRVQETIRIARLTEPEHIQRILDQYNRLLPKADQLQAAMILEVADESRWLQEFAFWQNFHGNQLRLRLGGKAYPAQLMTARPEDRCASIAYWVFFHIDPEARALLGDAQQAALLEMDCEGYQHQSGLLSDELRQSFLDDLSLSDRNRLPQAG